MKKLLVALAILLLLLSGCSSSNTASAPAKKAITMSVASFDLEFDRSGGWYKGAGYISVSGELDIANAPYLALLKISKVRGGDNNNLSPTYEQILVVNGTGQFSTFDIVATPDPSKQPEKPEYTFALIGYIPYEGVVGEPNKITFKVSSFELTYDKYEYKDVFMESYAGKGVISARGKMPPSGPTYL